MPTTSVTQTQCYHCGSECAQHDLLFDQKHFCCNGCRTVYEVLNANQLCQYYDLNERPGTQTQPLPQTRFAFLDLPDVQRQLVDFQNEIQTTITFYIPTIHCSSCLWLLEHSYRLNAGIRQARVDFLKKQVTLTFEQTRISLRQVVELLASLGYEPLISLSDMVKEQQRPTYRPLLYRLSVAGFCAGNIMLFSFPEYLGLDDPAFKIWFGIINLMLATPVVFYSGSGYFISVWQSLRKGIINIDFPILLGILVAYARGTYEVLALGGAGYFDSLSGLIFFLLCGKWFQQRTYDFLSFERDYKAYFPLTASQLTVNSEKLKVKNDLNALATDGSFFTNHFSLLTETPVPVAELRKGDRIRVRHGELIPADGLLYQGVGLIDYSFVTGESVPERKEPGALLYAGGRQMGEAIDLELVRETSQSYLTQLWNNDAFRKSDTGRFTTFADYVGRYFTLTVLTLATLTGSYWYALRGDAHTAVNAFTAVLIVACPCVLSLAYPVALGHGLRLLGKRRFYLKNADVIEQMAACDTVVFDKTGTLTEVNDKAVAGVTEDFSPALTDLERAMVQAVVRQSAHPLSRRLTRHLSGASPLPVEGFTEVPGQGVQALVDGWVVKVGRAAFVGALALPAKTEPGTTVHISIEGNYRGCFRLANGYRPGIETMLDTLCQTHRLYLLSGDTDATRPHLLRWFRPNRMGFGCSPQQKLDTVRQLQAEGRRVLMIGDGLNDAGALKQADVGFAVTDDTIQFTPASDGILAGESLRELPRFLRFSRFAMGLIRFSFGISLLYNFAGLSYALTGQLSPIVAAILMPLSSTTMVVIATIGTRAWWRIRA
ncbi:heavy metal translocating P-type ATPase [Spirosoma montaniterrae]|uniref:ATPase P n=1 Tax=Spirosoma montaniterrae TaxID=1178516 RepID=A0A1P9WU52_9BACT|nr:heavy metal translocating P-type ATPase metal-binding domain-containing protein [Spirosoma montaniterrae]AQG78907.1 ATPase P [Spirosoma montaniterrae]